jgi:energy-dependent translational throttle protein EttA
LLFFLLFVSVILSLEKVSKLVPPKRYLLQDVSLSFLQGAKIGVLGINGAGKSTLLNVIAGIDPDIEGKVTRRQNVSIGYLPQNPVLNADQTVGDYVKSALQSTQIVIDEYYAIGEQFSTVTDPDALQALSDRFAVLQALLDAKQGWQLDHHVALASEALRLPPKEARMGTLSGGEKRRVALCHLLLSQHDVLLLDEPTNHLDPESIARLEKYLGSFAGTVIAVTHDRYFLDRLASWILEIDKGRCFPYEGNYTVYLTRRAARLQQEKSQEAALQKSIQSELTWAKANPKARQSKNKARLSRLGDLQDVTFQKQCQTLALYIPPGPRLGNDVLKVDNVYKAFGDRVLLQDVSFAIPPGAIVGIIGANGLGKTTLFRLLTQLDVPDAGTITLGQHTRLAYADQLRIVPQATQTVWEAISGGQDYMTIGDYTIASRQYVGRFNFKGQDQQKQVGMLSGGERHRLHLARVLTEGANVLLLDEPTNDLDFSALSALEDALLNFPGCALVISHDRWFLDKIATHLLLFKGKGVVQWWSGNFSDYEASLA